MSRRATLSKSVTVRETCLDCGGAGLLLDFDTSTYGPCHCREQIAENANCPEALRRKIDELTEALTHIRNSILCPVGPTPTLDEVEEIASAALRAIEA